MSDPSSSSSVTSTQAWAPSTAPPDSSSPSAPGPIHTASSRFSFPPAAQPEIVRAYQKDVYYRDILRAQLSDVVRGLLGTRVLHTHADAVTLVAGLAYYALSSLGGTQTLGEEYVNAMMVESKSGRITALKRRSVFIALHVLAPFILARIYSSVRRAIVRAHTACEQAAARARFRAAATRGTAAPKESRIGKLLAYFSERLPALDSLTASDGWLAYAGAAHLALFYLGGRYYGVAQRLAGVQYVSRDWRTLATRWPHSEGRYDGIGLVTLERSSVTRNTVLMTSLFICASIPQLDLYNSSPTRLASAFLRSIGLPSWHPTLDQTRALP